MSRLPGSIVSTACFPLNETAGLMFLSNERRTDINCNYEKWKVNRSGLPISAAKVGKKPSGMEHRTPGDRQ